MSDDLRAVLVLGDGRALFVDLDRKEQLANTFDRDLPDRSTVAVEEVVKDEVLQALRGLVDTVHDQAVEAGSQDNDRFV